MNPNQTGNTSLLKENNRKKIHMNEGKNLLFVTARQEGKLGRFEKLKFDLSFLSRFRSS